MNRTESNKSISVRNKFQQLLQESHIRCQDFNGTVEKLIAVAEDGPDKLQFICDFDKTLTHSMVNGKRVATSFGVIDESPLFPDEVKCKADTMRKFYYGVEISHDYTFEEKFVHMEKWWREAEQLMLNANIYKSDLDKYVKASSIHLREGSHELLTILHEFSVPVLILSAGLGDVISEIFRLQSKVYSNMQIISNMMRFNDDGRLVGFQGEVIHSYNKTKASQHNASYFEQHNKRFNLVLLGDTQGDLHMADGVQYVKNKITIGFLNTRVDELYNTYLQLYDIVVVGDENMDPVNEIISTALEPEEDANR